MRVVVKIIDYAFQNIGQLVSVYGGGLNED